MLRQNLKQLQEAQKLEKKCNDYIKQCKNQLDQLKLEYSGRSGRYSLRRQTLWKERVWKISIWKEKP